MGPLHEFGGDITQFDVPVLRQPDQHLERLVGPGTFDAMTGREACERLAAQGVLAKDTHGSTIRLAPPLVITKEELDQVVDALSAILRA